MAFSHVSGKPFLYRIAPHKIMEDEYPQDYYKFRNPRVADAFWRETLGKEITTLPTRRIRIPKNI